MTTTVVNKLQLNGCAPEPLAAYLKALGILRLVAEQKDNQARAYWQGGSVLALQSRLDREGLLRFFLEEYRPTPIIAPWNGGSGFYPNDNREAITAIEDSASPRLEHYRQIVRQAQGILQRLQGVGTGKRADVKEETLEVCRNTLPDAVLPWLDAAYVLTDRKPIYPPLLGTGGNDGRLDFTNHFMQNLRDGLALPNSKESSKRQNARQQQAAAWLEAALFAETGQPLPKRALGQFQGGEVLTNPWDYVLMLEGALLFAGAVSRRLSAESRGKATFPFTVDTSAAGYGTATDTEYTNDGSRAELWVPLWEQPATLAEVNHLFGEGRAQLGRRQAATGSDFARAVIGLGVERGISHFQRFGFLKRNGLAFIATPLGRLRTRDDADSVRRANLLLELDDWLRGLREVSKDRPNRKAPESIKGAVREIDRTILEFCAEGSPRQLQEVLITLGRAEAWLATARSLGSARPHPLPGLSPSWLAEADDGSPEFRLATALASIRGDRERKVGSLRVNLEPVAWKGYWVWADDDTSVVWRDGDPLQSLAAVLERRCLEARMKGVAGAQGGGRVDGESSGNAWNGLPVYGPVAAPLADVNRFITGQVDCRRLADLLLPLSTINWFGPLPALSHWPYGESFPTLSRAYATLKLLFLPRDFHWRQDSAPIPIRPEPALLPLLRAGRVNEAHQLAARRLRVCGLPPLNATVNLPHHQGVALAAALLLPLRESDVRRLAMLCLESSKEPGS